jgi:hypothetical protein
MTIAVVMVGYNRPVSIKRLCDSILTAKCNFSVDIVLSVDKSEKQEEVLKAVESIQWDHGRVILKKQKNRLGLREHIFACADLTEYYEAVIILEDDIVVSDSFFNYVIAALDFTANDKSVAGISLYSPMINEMAILPFTAKRCGFDNYYLQSAQSWGQCWSKRMWREFRAWYAQNSEKLVSDDDMPSRIYSWPETSWKKYFMKYLAETQKMFFYPYDSLSSNYSDVGQHNKSMTPYYQVPLVSEKTEFKFGTTKETPCYDIFFERMGLKVRGEDLCMDLYGTKRFSDSRFVLTPKKLCAPIVQSYGLSYRPQEDNFLKGAEGNDIFIYDLYGFDNLWIGGSKLFYKLAKYHTNLSWRHALLYSVGTIIIKFFGKVKIK